MGDQDHEDKRQQDDECDLRVNQHHEDDGTYGKKQQSDEIVHPQGEERYLEGIAAEPARGFSR